MDKLNKSETSLLTKNFTKVVDTVSLKNKNDNGEVHNLTNSSIISFSKMSNISDLRS